MRWCGGAFLVWIRKSQRGVVLSLSRIRPLAQLNRRSRRGGYGLKQGLAAVGRVLPKGWKACHGGGERFVIELECIEVEAVVVWLHRALLGSQSFPQPYIFIILETLIETVHL